MEPDYTVPVCDCGSKTYHVTRAGIHYQLRCVNCGAVCHLVENRTADAGAGLTMDTTMACPRCGSHSFTPCSDLGFPLDIGPAVVCNRCSKIYQRGTSEPASNPTPQTSR